MILKSIRKLFSGSIAPMPIDALFLGVSSHYAHHTIRKIIKGVSVSDAIRSISFATQLNVARDRLIEHHVNTIIVFDHFDHDENWSNTELANFIGGVRQSRPDVFFIYCGSDQRFESVRKVFPRLSHYTRVDLTPGAAQEPTAIESQISDALEVCQQWLSDYFKYDVALSYAGEDAVQASKFERAICRKLRCFSYKRDSHEYAGGSLNSVLPEVYEVRTRLFLPIITARYLEKPWTRQELQSALTSAKKRGVGFILPVVTPEIESAARAILGDIVHLSITDRSAIRRALDYRLLPAKNRKAGVILHFAADSEQIAEWNIWEQFERSLSLATRKAA